VEVVRHLAEGEYFGDYGLLEPARVDLGQETADRVEGRLPHCEHLVGGPLLQHFEEFVGGLLLLVKNVPVFPKTKR
jgi:hypothetical protein